MSQWKCALPIVIMLVFVLMTGGLRSQTPTCYDPWVLIPVPGDGAQVSGTTDIEVAVKKGVKFEKIEFLVDGTVIATTTMDVLTVKWNTTAREDGEHKLQAKGTLADGTVKESKIVTVTVKNN